MRKSFDELTIADDYMFCKVMQDEETCKTFLEMTLAAQIGKISYLSSQNAIITGAEAKSIRLDVLVKDENGKSYDIEMQAVNEHNLPKRMRYYQAALDILFLDKGEHYSSLNDSYIIFLCLFDSVGKGMPLYTFENICLEDRKTLLNDGTKKIIINANAFRKTEDKDLSGFLEYVKTGKITTDFTGRIDKMIEKLKTNEQARSEYRFISTLEMDARHYGIQEGIAQGSYQTKLETAKLMIAHNYPVSEISLMTGLPQEEIEKL
ncbi:MULTISPECIES: Rpn family recombination-promoting nuclease/putative transposase [unclassified Treponema]|uniref:Rpn family recombination-promoting nuclease/putative transposase n=1 Tax=unclassified Treponema TaxID=2638727 RepID=UPI0020A3190C|nr:MULTISPECIES: Rpn family recombination-promoting nuclease/putative transposase [unclassified Treponema]UTC68273.1 Rpn family recombination-promoting nuclease/putative transposase [Treponema sp. OMZ 789]UTC70993.1 Rpn family recombination-promoting nuclease/putative transposase [Treponema sp. OMZ 790]UTC73734.1 Rpn family recombination-promoting nuclease/putative transposase [Treponema sp. OMZ 791]